MKKIEIELDASTLIQLASGMIDSVHRTTVNETIVITRGKRGDAYIDKVNNEAAVKAWERFVEEKTLLYERTNTDARTS